MASKLDESTDPALFEQATEHFKRIQEGGGSTQRYVVAPLILPFLNHPLSFFSSDTASMSTDADVIAMTEAVHAHMLGSEAAEAMAAMNITTPPQKPAAPSGGPSPPSYTPSAIQDTSKKMNAETPDAIGIAAAMQAIKMTAEESKSSRPQGGPPSAKKPDQGVSAAPAGKKPGSGPDKPDSGPKPPAGIPLTGNFLQDKLVRTHTFSVIPSY
jgi:hypothetical protein